MEKINKEFLQERVRSEVIFKAGTYFRGEKATDAAKEELSPVELFEEAFMKFFDELSPEFKKMKSLSLKETVETCYKEEYLSGDYPAWKQVEKCRKNVEFKHLGRYFRTRDQYRINSDGLNSD